MIFLFILIFSIEAVAQDSEPAQRQFYYRGRGWGYFNGNDSYLKPDNFIFNFHWDHSPAIIRSFGFNAVHIESEVNNGQGGLRFIDPDLDRLSDSSWLILNVPHIGHHWDGYKPLYSMCIRYEPTLKIDSSNPGLFNPRIYDQTRPIFGFKHIIGQIDNVSGTNYSRLLLKPDDLNGQSSIIALADPWVANTFTHTNLIYAPNTKVEFYNNIYNDGNEYPHLPVAETNGDRLYLSVNLRRTDPEDTDTTDEPVIGIKLRYVNLRANDTTIFPRLRGCIKFDSIPRTTAYNRQSFQSGRGKIKYTEWSDNDTIFYITKKMIPLLSDNQPDMTYSAHFTSGLDINIYNFYLKGKLYDTTFYRQNSVDTTKIDTIHTTHARRWASIDSLQIEVIYYGHCKIGIDYVKIECNAARKVSFGQFDDMIFRKVRDVFDSITQPKFQNRDIRPYRLYLKDETGIEEGSYLYTHYYFTKLCGNIFTTEAGPLYDRQFSYYLDLPNLWNGFYKILAWMGTPYIRNTTDLRFNFGMKNGYQMQNRGNDPQTVFQNVINSDYETNTGSKDFQMFMTDTIMPEKSFYTDVSAGLFAYLESRNYQNYYNPVNNSFLYSDIPWSSQANMDGRFVAHKYNIDGVDTLIYGYQPSGPRHFTAEEMRLFWSHPLIYGCHGLQVDGAESMTFSTDAAERTIKLQHGQWIADSLGLNELDDWDYINDERNGGDFLRHDIRDSTYITDFIYWPKITDSLGIPPDRLYVGRTSMRREIKKTVDFVRRIEPELLELKFRAGMSKGFKKYYTQAPGIAMDTLLNLFVSTNTEKWKTRPLGRTHIVDSLEVPFYENYGICPRTGMTLDSSFFDATLLYKNTTVTNLNSAYTLGLSNKRTDPLIYFTEDTTDKHFIFLSDYELDTLCQQGGVNPYRPNGPAYSPLTWQNYFWKRQSAREINVPLCHGNAPQTFEGRFLHVYEMGAYDNILNSFFWRDSIYYHLIDTIVPEDSWFTAYMLPGQSKLINIEPVENEPATNGGCHLAEVFNNGFEIYTRKVDGEDCCWDVFINNNDTCKFPNFPINIYYSSWGKDLNVNFDSTRFTSGKYRSYNYNLEAGKLDTLENEKNTLVARICMEPNQYSEIKIVAGGLYNDELSVFTFEQLLECDPTDSMCCNATELDMTLTDSATVVMNSPIGSNNWIFTPPKYNIKFDRYLDSCYHRMEVWREHLGGTKTKLDTLGADPFDPNTYDVDVCDPFDARGNFEAYNFEDDTVCLKFYFINSQGDTVCVKDSCVIFKSDAEPWTGDDTLIYNPCGDSVVFILPLKELPVVDNNLSFDIQVIPNPFTNETELTYILPNDSEVDLEIFNSIGIKVKDVNLGNQQKGKHSFILSGNNLNSGIYYLKFNTNKLNYSVPLILIK